PFNSTLCSGDSSQGAGVRSVVVRLATVAELVSQQRHETAQRVERIGIRQRDRQPSDIRLQAVKFIKFGTNICVRFSRLDLLLDGLQILVPAVDPRSHTPVVGRRNQLEQRIDQRDQRKEYDLEPIYQVGGPKGKITLQQRRAGIEKAFRGIADWEIQKFGRGKSRR